MHKLASDSASCTKHEKPTLGEVPISLPMVRPAALVTIGTRPPEERNYRHGSFSYIAELKVELSSSRKFGSPGLLNIVNIVWSGNSPKLEPSKGAGFVTCILNNRVSSAHQHVLVARHFASYPRSSDFERTRGVQIFSLWFLRVPWRIFRSALH